MPQISTQDTQAFVLRLPEMIHEIHQHCGLDSLVALAGVNLHMRSSVKSYVLRFVIAKLQPFFPTHNGMLSPRIIISPIYPSEALCLFWDELHRAAGVVSGALASSIVRNDQFWPVDDLDIVVPLGSTQSIRQHIIKSGYRLHSNSKLPRTLAGPCKSYTTFNSAHHLRRITVSESEDLSVLSHILGAPHTAFMNALTPTKILSFYPSFTTAHVTLEAKHSPPDPFQYYKDMGLEFYQSVADMCQPCGIACPEVYRRVRGGRGILSFDWDSDRSSDLRPLDAHVLDWRLGSSCDNVLCTFF